MSPRIPTKADPPHPIMIAVAADVQSAMTAWWDCLQEQRASTHTLNAYRRDLAAFLTHLAGQRGQPVRLADLAALQPDAFDGYCAQRSAQGQAPASLARALSTLRNFFRFLDSRDLAHNLHIKALANPRIPKPISQTLSREAAQKTVEVIADLSDTPWIARRDEALFALLYGSGLRLGEALALQRGQAPHGERLAIVGRDNRQRTVTVLPFVPSLIADYLRACPYQLDDSQPLFLGARGGPLNPGVVQRQMRRLRGLLGLPYGATPQALRRSFAMRLHAEGGDLRVIQALLGHAHLATTQRCFGAGGRSKRY